MGNTIVEEETLRSQSSCENLYDFQFGKVLFLGLFSLLAGLSVTKYYNLHTTFYDLGIFLNHFSNIASGDYWRLFTGHVQPSLMIWSTIYKVVPEGLATILILSIQSAVLAWPVAILYSHYGLIPALAYALYFPVWFNALFDFHVDHLAVIILFGFFFSVKSGRIPLAVMLALLLALVKEPFALQTTACGIYLLIFKKRQVAGLFLILFGLSYFYAATQFFWPYFTTGPRGGGGAEAYSWLGNSYGEMLWFIISKPHLVFHEIFSDTGKIRYLLLVFGVLGFIPLLKPSFLVVALPILTISLLSKFKSSYGLNYHYTAGLIAPLTLAFAEGIPKAVKIWARLKLPPKLFPKLLLTGLLICHFLNSPSPVSNMFWWRNSFGYSVNAYIPEKRNQMIKRALYEHVPSDRDIAISTQNSVNWNHLANRKFYFPFPAGVLKPHKDIKGTDRTFSGIWSFISTGNLNPPEIQEHLADYVILDMKRPRYIIDRTSRKNPEVFLNLVRQTKKVFQVVFEEDGFSILKRRKN